MQVLFRYRAAATPEVQQAATDRAHKIASEVPGLVWKIWTYDPASLEAGGVYLFTDEASAQAYLEGPIFAGLKAIPAIEHMQVKLLAVDCDRSQITRAPLSG
ncbi:MAG: YdhR family protein [Leptolyngbyaceae cyanobacterium SM1_1_3]|nr:YdhR family protein [Leptolyngbyaceae cyanobacterium SM1_1_3]NJN04861.1 YdhR family protein [Leptolyngbyaceae cyanobacterium RM1_1_2]NJO10296.1 YdhR family protein [Leptolyngbyaceae cyanobacterium SL_1_1]